MQAISRSLIQLLTHSYITLFAITLTTAVFIAVLTMVTSSGESDQRLVQMVLLMTLTLSMFFGVYFAGALASLRSFYLWHTNPKYKRSLLISVLILSGIFCILMGPYLYPIVSSNVLIIILPATLMLFSMYVLLGNKLLHKILIPTVPGVIYYLYTLGFAEDMMLSALFAATVILIIYMFIQSVQYKEVSSINDFLAMSKVSNAKASSNIWISFNKSVGALVNRSILNGRQQLDWIVSLPSTKIGLLASFNALIVIAMLLFLTPKKEALYEVFTQMMLAMSMLSIIMESRNLIKQVKAIAHIFPGEKHFALKNKILFAVDKIVIWNTLIFMSVILVYLYFTNTQIDYILLVSSCLIIIMLTMSLLPFFLTLSWINVNFVLLIAVVSYFILLIITLGILRSILQTDMILVLSILLLGALFGIRTATEHYFSKRPLEKLIG